MSRTTRLIARVRSQMALVGAAEDLQRGLAAGAVALALLLGVRALGWLSLDVSSAALLAGMVAAVFPLVGLLYRRRDAGATALLADTHLGLAERVSTSLWAETARRDDAGPLADLVVADAENSAATVSLGAIRKAFRPRLLRRDLTVAAIGLVACGALFFVRPATAAPETPVERAARLADEDRIAAVARRVAKAADRVAATARDQNQIELEKIAGRVERDAGAMAKAPPPRPAAMRKLNELSDLAREAARRKAGMPRAQSAPEAAKMSRELAEVLKQLASIGLENVQKEMSDLAKRLEEGNAGDSPPRPDELRDLADKMDALRRAMERAGEMGAGDMREKLRSLGNEELLKKIADKLRELAKKMEDDPGYESLQSEDTETLDLSDLSEEELEELLRQLDEMAALEDLARMAKGAGGEMGGGKKLRISGLGTCSGGGNCGLHGGHGQGQGQGQGEGQGQGRGQGNGGGMGGEGTGAGGTAGYEDLDSGMRAEPIRGRLDPKGRIAVTTFRGLPRPGQVGTEFRRELERARADAQAPLQTETIPRRYREGIRRYFDGLGEDEK